LNSIALISIVVIILVIAFFVKLGREQARSAAGSLQSGSPATTGNRHLKHDTDDTGIFIPLNYSDLSDEVTDVEIELVDVSSLRRPSPERPVTNEDAAIIDIIRQSPELPSAVIELSELLRDPSSSIRKIVELISTDPVLSAKILRVVNSAATGLDHVTSLHQAVVLLGFNNIWILVNQMLTSRAIKPFANLEQGAIKALWRHAAASATCAKHILFNAGLATSEIAPTVFTCSLLHDVGKFLLRGLDAQGDTGSGDVDCTQFSVLKEDSIYGIDHCRMGYLLTTYWKLPEVICSTIGYHHHPSFENWQEIPKHIRKTVYLVSLSDHLANRAGYWDFMPCSFELREEVLHIPGLDKGFSVNKLLNSELFHNLKHTEALIDAATSEM